MGPLAELLLRLHASLATGSRRRDDRGDVPGWVLVTIMSVGIVMAIWAVAEPELKNMLQVALAKVK